MRLSSHFYIRRTKNTSVYNNFIYVCFNIKGAKIIKFIKGIYISNKP